jgi:hypothetical protein
MILQVWKKNGVEWHLNNSRVMDTLAKYKVVAENLKNRNSNIDSENIWRKNNAVIFDIVILFALLLVFLYFI